MVITNLLLNHLERPAFVQMAQQPPTELNIFCQAAFDHDQPHGCSVYCQLAGHSVIHHQFAGWRRIARVGREGQPSEMSFRSIVLKEKSIWNGAEKLFGLVFILLGPMRALGLLSGIIYQVFHSLLVFFALFRSERMAIDEERSGQRSLSGLNHIAVLGI